DILEATRAIRQFCAGTHCADFMTNEMQRSAVLLQLIVIGEAAAHLSEEFKARHPEIEWVDIIGFRNFAVHAYFAVDWYIVWTTATQDVPAVETQVMAVLEQG
ncbi:MAG: DUF86 domain-containing protein, partial [Chloroflexi bacterium]|nr:DUF86 domain-containing protein [Chloroflexota bacterium]